MEDERVKGKLEAVGYIVKRGALQGYLIHKATADAHGIDNLADLKDLRLARLFDADGDGKADLIGCNPGWGCEKVIEHHLDAYGLRGTVEHVQGAYFALMGDALRRYEEGRPILFYTWTPNWTIHRLKPGKDVVWLEVPFPDLPRAQKELEPYTEIAGVEGCVDDPCQMGWPANDIRVVANKGFLAANPAARKLFEQVAIPLADIAAQNVRMYQGESSEADVWRHADEWIEAHRSTVDAWLEAARGAAAGP
jgi:glycine betaine/proline transport system substrate-binding protein